MSGEQIIGLDFGLKSTMALIGQVARHDIPVLVLGETGVGKDIIANAIHNASSRSEGPYILTIQGFGFREIESTFKHRTIPFDRKLNQLL